MGGRTLLEAPRPDGAPPGMRAAQHASTEEGTEVGESGPPPAGARPEPGASAPSPAPARPEAGASAPSPAPARPDRRVALTAVALLAAALVAVLAVRAGTATEATSAATDLSDPVLGDPDAPVELVEYSDFGCPYCQQHASDVKPQIIADYVETGAVRYVWRDLPYQGEASYRAALAAREAQAQGRFWEYHDALFAEGERGLDPAELRLVAENVGLDLEAFDEALATEKHAPLVDAGLEDGRAMGLSGTPAFTVNGERILGAQPYEVFAEVIERAVAEASD